MKLLYKVFSLSCLLRIRWCICKQHKFSHINHILEFGISHSLFLFPSLPILPPCLFPSIHIPICIPFPVSSHTILLSKYNCRRATIYFPIGSIENIFSKTHDCVDYRLRFHTAYSCTNKIRNFNTSKKKITWTLSS